MSDRPCTERKERDRTSLWLVRCVDGSGWHLFSGALEEMAAHIDRLHLATGRQHAAREVEH